MFAMGLVNMLPAQTPANKPKPLTIDEALVAYDQALSRAEQKIAELQDQQKAKELAAKTEADRLAANRAAIEAAQKKTGENESQYRLTLTALLQEMLRQDAEIERALLNRKLRLSMDRVPPPPPTPPLPAGTSATGDTTELLRAIHDRIHYRDILSKTLLADRLGAAGQDVLEADTPNN
jgi:uncharacterized membrane protein YccC